MIGQWKPEKMGLGLASKLGSALVHADEALSPDGRDIDTIDKDAFYRLLKDPEVAAWMKSLGPLLPVKRVKGAKS